MGCTVIMRLQLCTGKEKILGQHSTFEISDIMYKKKNRNER